MLLRRRSRILLALGAGLVLAVTYLLVTAGSRGSDDMPQVTLVSRFYRPQQEGVCMRIRAPKRRVLDVRQICTQRGPFERPEQTIIPQRSGGFTLYTPVGAYFKLSPGTSTQYWAWGLGPATVPEALSSTGHTRLAVFGILEDHNPSTLRRLSACVRLRTIHPLFQRSPLTEAVIVLADPITNALPLVSDGGR